MVWIITGKRWYFMIKWWFLWNPRVKLKSIEKQLNNGDLNVQALSVWDPS